MAKYTTINWYIWYEYILFEVVYHEVRYAGIIRLGLWMGIVLLKPWIQVFGQGGEKYGQWSVEIQVQEKQDFSKHTASRYDKKSRQLQNKSLTYVQIV